MIPTAKAKLLEGKRGLIAGIANDSSIAWGCAKAFRALGCELAVTYLNDKAKKFVEPLARELEAPILMPLRMSLIPVPWWELTASLGGVALAAVAAIWVSARIYRVGLLMYGKRPTMRELAQWVKYAG